MFSQIIVSTNLKEESISTYDLHSYSHLGSLKNNASYQNSLALTPDIHNQPGSGWIFSAQKHTGKIHVWNWQKDSPSMLIFTLEKISCLNLSGDGKFCVVGTLEGYLCMFSVGDGKMLARFQAHYRKVNVIKFSADNCLILSGGEDGAVHAFEIDCILNGLFEPKFSLNDHSLPVLDLWISFGLALNLRIFTCSVDKSCFVYDQEIKFMQIKFPFIPNCLQVNAVESFAYFGLDSGDVVIVNLSSKATSLGIIGCEEFPKLRTANGSVKSLALSLDDAFLVAATENAICVWDLTSQQMLKTLDIQSNFVQIILKPIHFFTHTKEKHLLPLAQFKRAVDQNDQIEQVHIQPIPQEPSSLASQERFTLLQKDYEELKEKHEKYKAMHEEYYELVSKHFLKPHQ